MSIECFALSGGMVFNVYAIESISPVTDPDSDYRSNVRMRSGQQWLDRRTVETIAHDLGLGVGPQDAL